MCGKIIFRVSYRNQKRLHVQKQTLAQAASHFKPEPGLEPGTYALRMRYANIPYGSLSLHMMPYLLLSHTLRLHQPFLSFRIVTYHSVSCTPFLRQNVRQVCFCHAYFIQLTYQLGKPLDPLSETGSSPSDNLSGLLRILSIISAPVRSAFLN